MVSGRQRSNLADFRCNGRGFGEGERVEVALGRHPLRQGWQQDRRVESPVEGERIADAVARDALAGRLGAADLTFRAMADRGRWRRRAGGVFDKRRPTRFPERCPTPSEQKLPPRGLRQIMLAGRFATLRSSLSGSSLQEVDPCLCNRMGDAP